MPIDQLRLRHDIVQLTADCIHLKRLLGVTWVRPMAEEQQRQARVRRKLTELFVLLAASRGKLHVRREDAVEYHRLVAERLSPDYALALPDEVRV